MRPIQPLPFKPAGYLQLESYSSLRRFWTYLDAAERAGRRVLVPRNESEAACRRRIEGFTLGGAGVMLDAEKAAREVDEGLVPHPALIALAGGDPAPLREFLNEAYELRLTFVLGFVKTRDLILKPEFVYKPLGEDVLKARLVPRRFGRDELRFLLERACGMA